MTNKIPDETNWLENDRDTRRLGYLLAAVLLIVVGGWAAFAPLESAAIAPGIIQVQGKRQSVQHLEGGIIADILVSSGTQVVKGQPLILLDAARDRAEKVIYEGRIFNTQATVDRLIAERDDLPQLAFRSALEAASGFDSRAAAAISSESSLFAVRRADRLGEAAVLNAKRDGLSAVLNAKRDVLVSLSTEITDLQILLKDGFVDKRRIRELERSKAQLLGDIADLEVSVTSTDLEILQLNKRFKTAVVDELTVTLEQLYDLEQQYTAIADRVERATIRSPAAGEVLDLKLNSIGGVVSSGEKLMEIVPDLDTLFVEARVMPIDIDRISLGQEAEIRLSVLKDAYLVTGTLSKISADRIVDEGSDVAYYDAEIVLHDDDLKLLEGVELIPGMPAEVIIKTGNRTMLGYITSPLNRMFSKSLTED